MLEHVDRVQLAVRSRKEAAKTIVDVFGGEVIGDGEVRPLDNLRESIVRTALAQGATVEVVGGPAAERLAAEGGVGAWLRTA